MTDVLADAAARAIRYLAEREIRPVFPAAAEVRALEGFVEPMPDRGAAPAEVLALLDQVGSPGTVVSNGGRYFGFVTGAADPVGIGAGWLAAAWDQNAALGIMSPTAGVLDRVVGSWLVQLFGLPAAAQVTFASGTSVANAVCLAAARDRVLLDAGWDCAADGLIGAPEVMVVVSEAAHSSVTKALGFIGLGRSRVTTVPADDQGRMRPDALRSTSGPTIVVTQLGNVNSGACDPVAEVVAHYAGDNAWVHVDGAFGLWAATTPSTAHLVAGMEAADSWATDMHKWLNVTYDSAVAVVADPASLARTFSVGAEYIPDSPGLEPLDRGPGMSQRARAVETWAVLKSLGRDGVEALIDRCCRLARRFAEELEEAGFTVHNEVVLNQVLVSLETDEATDALLDAVATDGRLWAGGSIWRGRRVMRISVSSAQTTDDDVDLAVAALIELAGV